MAQTGSPGLNLVTRDPTAATSPLMSNPGMNGNFNQRTIFNIPLRIFQSTGLTPAARTRISTSSGRGLGSFRSTRVSFSLGPYSLITTARMALFHQGKNRVNTDPRSAPRHGLGSRESDKLSSSPRWRFGLVLAILTRLLFSSQFLDQPLGVIDRPQGLDDAARVYRYGTRELVIIAVIENQRLDIAVEDQADDLVVAVDDRAT